MFRWGKFWNCLQGINIVVSVTDNDKLTRSGLRIHRTVAPPANMLAIAEPTKNKYRDHDTPAGIMGFMLLIPFSP